jgi:hypothetical protein
VKKETKYIMLLVIMIAGCSTTSVKNVSCDFVVAAAESEQDRKQKNRLSPYTSAKQNKNDTANGILSVLFGSLARSFSSKENQHDRCN